MADINSAAKDVAKQMDSSVGNSNRTNVNDAMSKCIAEINADNRNDPNTARAMRRQFVQKIDAEEINGQGLDLTIKYDSTTKQPKHFTIMSADLIKHAASIANNLDSNRQAQAEKEYFEVEAKIRSQGTRADQRRDLDLFKLTIDAYEKDGPGERDDVQITYDARTNQPVSEDIDFTPKAVEVDKVGDPAAGKKPTPKDGSTIPLEKLLSEYSTSFGDAYERSKKAVDGDPAKSKALEEAIDRLKRSPWPIKVKFDSKSERPEYNSDTSTITLNPNELAPKQIEQFTHEAYHATHQSLAKLFLNGKLSKEEYTRAKNEEEVNAFESEIKVHQELTRKMSGASEVVFRYVDRDNQKALKDLSELYAKEGKAGLAKFITEEGRTVMTINNRTQLASYSDYFATAYPAYANQTNFGANERMIRSKIASSEEWRKGIADGF